MQSLFNLWQRTCQQEAPGGGLFSSITSSLFNLAALIVWNATMLWIQGHKNLHFQWYWLLSRISSFFPWSGNCTLVIAASHFLNFWQKYWWFASWLASDPPEPTDLLRDLVQLEDAQLGGAQLADQQVVVLAPASLQHHISPLPSLSRFSHLNVGQNIVEGCYYLRSWATPWQICDPDPWLVGPPPDKLRRASWG